MIAQSFDDLLQQSEPSEPSLSPVLRSNGRADWKATAERLWADSLFNENAQAKLERALDTVERSATNWRRHTDNATSLSRGAAVLLSIIYDRPFARFALGRELRLRLASWLDNNANLLP